MKASDIRRSLWVKCSIMSSFWRKYIYIQCSSVWIFTWKNVKFVHGIQFQRIFLRWIRFSYYNISWISRSGSTELLKSSNLTLKRKQFCTPKGWNVGNVLLTSRICLKYVYQCRAAAAATIFWSAKIGRGAWVQHLPPGSVNPETPPDF